MPLDPQIALSAAQQPSFAQQAGQVYQLADAVRKQQEAQQLQKDQQFIQQGLKDGANFETPEGILEFSQKAKGNISPQTYMTLTQAAEEAKTQRAKQQEYYAKAEPEVIKAQQEKLNFMAERAEAPLAAYDAAIKAGAKPEEANLAFENAKALQKQQVENMTPVGGKPIIPPQAVAEFMAANPAQLKSKLETVKSHQETLMAAAKLRKEEQDIKTSAALEGKYKREPAYGAPMVPESISKSELHGEEFLKQLSPGDQAQVRSVAEGRTQISDISLRRRERISQLVNQYDPSFTSMEYHADKVALTNLSKDLTAIRPFGEMLDKNADIAVDLSKKVIKTDSRLANKSLNWISQNLGDNPDMAEFLAQTRIVQTEAARVLNNPRLVGQLSDSARIEMEHVVNGEMPVRSYERVIRRIQQDGKNRIQAMEKERARILKQVPASEIGAEPAKAGKPKTAPSGATPKLPPKNARGWILHTDAKGNKAYVGPKGEIEEVK